MWVEFSTIPKGEENQIDPSLTNGESRSIVSVPDGAGQTDGSVHTEVHLLRQLHYGEVDAFFFMDKNFLNTKAFSLQECFVFSVIVVFSEDNLNNCGNLDT